jgi:hypothetical protein
METQASFGPSRRKIKVGEPAPQRRPNSRLAREADIGRPG